MTRLKRPSIVLLLLIFIAAFFGFSSVAAGEMLGIYHRGKQPGHWVCWDGNPILLIGDSVTQGWMELGKNFKQEEYIDALASRGINLLMIWSYIGTDAHRQKEDPRIGYDAQEIWPWQGSPDKGNFDLTRFNLAYFEKLKDLVAYAEKQRIIILITVHDGWTKDRFKMHPFNASLGNGPLTDKRQYVELADYEEEMPIIFNRGWRRKQKNQYFQERFCDKLITELNSYKNVVYEMFNEGEWYNRRYRNQHEQHFLTFFRVRCNNLLVTNTDHIFGDNPHADNKVDVVSFHGNWKDRFSDFESSFNNTPPKPCLLSEPVPEFRGSNFLDTIRQSVWGVTMGGASWLNQNDTSFGWDPNTEIASKATVRDKAYDYAGHCARFFNSSRVNFSDMRPRGDLSSTGICMAREGVEYVVYTPSGGTFTVDLSATSGALRGQWYDPRAGHFSGKALITGGRVSTFITPDENDWVLYIISDYK